ncbi:MAG: hypothetical protein ACRDQF_19065, partial [Thermocrispum sp.]
MSPHRQRHSPTRYVATVVGALLIVALGAQSAAAAVPTALPVASMAQQVTPPQQDPFYTPPDPLPDVPPGTILRSRPVDVSGNGFPVEVTAWQILYRSTSATHQPNAVSGTVLVPATGAPDGPRPLVSLVLCTNGIGR